MQRNINSATKKPATQLPSRSTGVKRLNMFAKDLRPRLARCGTRKACQSASSQPLTRLSSHPRPFVAE